MKILLVEDNLSIQKGLIFTLQANNYEVIGVTNCQETLEVLKHEKIALIILDVNLPDGDGFSLYEQIKSYQIKVIFLTVKDLEEDIVKGFALGCEDYITKPFKIGELLARIKRLLKPNENIIKIQDIKIDLDKREVKKNDKIITLTTLEYNIFLLLATNLNKVITRDAIINEIFELTGNDVYDNTVTVYIKRIREKLETDIIKTIKNVGYLIEYE